jgi:hypothetical protein
LENLIKAYVSIAFVPGTSCFIVSFATIITIIFLLFVTITAITIIFKSFCYLIKWIKSRPSIKELMDKIKFILLIITFPIWFIPWLFYDEWKLNDWNIKNIRHMPGTVTILGTGLILFISWLFSLYLNNIGVC